MNIGDISKLITSQLTNRSESANIGDARDLEFQKFLEKAAGAKEDKQLKEAASQFEALFVFQMMQSMRATVVKGGLMEESMGEKIFQGMLDQEYSIRMSETGSLGLSNLVYEQLKRK